MFGKLGFVILVSVALSTLLSAQTGDLSSVLRVANQVDAPPERGRIYFRRN